MGGWGGPGNGGYGGGGYSGGAGAGPSNAHAQHPHDGDWEEGGDWRPRENWEDWRGSRSTFDECNSTQPTGAKRKQRFTRPPKEVRGYTPKKSHWVNGVHVPIVRPWQAPHNWTNTRPKNTQWPKKGKAISALWSMSHADPNRRPCVPCEGWVRWARTLPEDHDVPDGVRVSVSSYMKHFLAENPHLLNGRGGLCPCCGKAIPAEKLPPGTNKPTGCELEHWTGYSENGHINNLRWLHVACHGLKSAIEHLFRTKHLPLPPAGKWLEWLKPCKTKPDNAKVDAAVQAALAAKAERLRRQG